MTFKVANEGVVVEGEIADRVCYQKQLMLSQSVLAMATFQWSC